MKWKTLLLVASSVLSAHARTGGAHEGDATTADPCSVTLLVEGMMKSRSGAT